MRMQEIIPNSAVIETHPTDRGALKGLEMLGATRLRWSSDRLTKAKVRSDPKLVIFATTSIFPSGRNERATSREITDATIGVLVRLFSLPRTPGSAPSLPIP